MKTYKILQLCAVDFSVKHLLLPLIDRLEEEGFEVRTVCSYGPYTADLLNRGYQIHNIKIVRKISIIPLLKATIQLYSYIRREKFDIVHVHTPVASVVGRIAARLARVPFIIYTAHGFYFHEGMPTLMQRLFITFEKFMGRLFTDVIFTQSGEDFQTALNEGIAAEGKAYHIGNGVDLTQFSLNNADDVRSCKRKEFGIDENAVVLGFVGRIVREKGILDLITAFSRTAEKYPNVLLMVIGDNSASERDNYTKEALTRLVAEFSLQEKVLFTGSRNDVNELLTAIDIFVLPSYREGMPRSIIEAMAAGKPVVATDIRGCREEVVHGETGYLVPVADPDELAKSLAVLIEKPETAKEMGTKGRERAQTLFNEKNVLDNQVLVFRLLLEKLR